MNKQGYIQRGREVAHHYHAAGTMPETGYPVTDGNGAAIAMNGSWQAMAWKQGFDEYRDEVKQKAANLRIAADLENAAHARSLETVGQRPAPPAWLAKHEVVENYCMTDYMPAACVEHVLRLRRICASATVSLERRARLQAKVEKLQAKHARLHLLNSY